MIMRPRTAEREFWNDPRIVRYFSQKPSDPRVMARLLRVPEPTTKVVLDIGCGAGRNSIAAAALGFIVHMCDPNPAMINEAAKGTGSHRDESSRRQHIVYGAMTALPYQSGLFDVLVACGVLHQAYSLAEYHRAVSELGRVARRGCVVTLNTFTNRVIDSRLVRVRKEPYSFITAEGLPLTLLPKEVFYRMMDQYGMQLEEEICEEIKIENTGPRAVLRANFVKVG